MKICLDTSAYSRFKRGAVAAIEVIRSARLVGIPAIVLGELRTGFRLGRRRAENEKELALVLANPVVRVWEVDDACSQHYAALVCALRRAGTPLPTNDIWIAALARREGATVVTYDRHFERIESIGTMVLG